MATALLDNALSQPAPNPFGAAQEGLNQGHQWAHDQAQLDVQRQQVQNQTDQVQQMKKEFDVKVGDQYFNEMADLAGMPNGPVKKARMQDLQDHAQQAGIALHPSMVASLGDENFTIPWAQLKEGFTGMKTDNPNAWNTAMEKIRTVMGNKASLTDFDKALQGINTVRAASVRAEASKENAQTSATATIQRAKIGAEATQNRITTGMIKNAQGTYDKAVQPITFALDGVARAKGLIEQAQDPNTPEDKRVALSKQIRTVLSNEEARLVTGKQNFGEGTASNMSVDTYAAKAKDLWSKIKDEPEDTISDANLNQMKNFYDELAGAYMEGHDRMANSKLGGSTDAQKQAIIGRAQALQKQYGKKFGKWGGPGLDLDATGNASQSKTNGSQSAATGTAQPAAAGQAASTNTNAAPASPPELVQKASQIFQTYKNTLKTDAAKAAMILKGMQKNFPSDIKQKLGLQ